MLVTIFVLIMVFVLWRDIQSHSHDGNIAFKDAFWWSVRCFMLAFCFGLAVCFFDGYDAGMRYFSAYIMTNALSMDNLFVFSSVFMYFGIRPEFKHRILHYGIIGAAVFRLLFTALGIESLNIFGRPMEFFFMCFIAFSALSILNSKESSKPVDHANRWYIRWVKRWIPVTADASQNRFFVRGPLNGMNYFVRHATPLFLCLVAVEVTDIVFSFDSTSVVLSITRDPLLIYASTMFAVISLRCMYFIMEALRRYFSRLDKAIVVILFLVAAKLGLHAVLGIEVSAMWSLLAILAILVGGVLSSVGKTQKEEVV